MARLPLDLVYRDLLRGSFPCRGLVVRAVRAAWPLLKIPRGMTAEDIPHLQDLKPLKSFELPPGDSIAFTMVFLKPAKHVKDFSLEVVLADGEV